MCFLQKKLIVSIVVAASFLYSTAQAGFLDMPEITESPTLKRESLLRDLDIPPVRDRDPNPEGGPRLAVTEFRLQGVVEYPELDITLEKISKLVEGIRFDFMGEDQLLESGYTMKEITEVTDTLVQIEKETIGRSVTPIELQRLVWLVQSQRERRGITLGMIETIADKITNYYRERGFILAKAYIPEQEVRDGVVTLTMLLGHLGGVNIQGNALYNNDAIAAVFDDAMFKPVTHDSIEEKLYLLNDYPGISAHGFFAPGTQVGDSDLTVTIKNETEFQGNVRVDNHGSAETGEYRLYGELFYNNPLGYADQLHLAYLNSFKPDNSNYGQIKYKINVLNSYNQLSLLFATNQFDLGPGNVEAINALKLTGDTAQSEVDYRYILKRGRKSNHKTGLSINKTESKIDTRNTGSFGGQFDDTVRNTSLVYEYDVLNEQDKFLHQGKISLTSGKFLKGVEPGGEQKDQYYFATMDYTLLSFFKVPYFAADTRIILNTSLQFAGSPISSINQFNIGGPTRVRAYPVNIFAADNAVFVGAQWLFNTPDFMDFIVSGNTHFKEAAQLFLFADMSYGKQMNLDPTGGDKYGQLADAGFGLEFSYLADLKSNIQIAFPMHSKFTSQDISNETEGVRLVFDLQYKFL